MPPWLSFASGLAVALALLPALWWWQERRHRANLTNQQQRFNETSQREHQQLIERLHVRQQALFNGMIEGVLLLDEQGRVQMINESLRKVFDITTDIRGQTIMEALRWHELAALAARLAAQKHIIEAELEIHRATRRSLRVNATIVHSHSGAPAGQLFVFHDVTRLKELENMRQEFVGNVSHELRTPLSLIKGFAQTLLDGAKDDPDQAGRFLQKIDKHSDRLLFLIEDLLAISRLESGHAAMNPQMIDLHDLTQRVLEDLSAPASARKVKLQNKIAARTSVWADTERLQQVLFNLVDNAIKYGRKSGTVTVGVNNNLADKLEVFVADDGPGIPPDSLSRVFERFYRVDRARSRESGGTGLGLAIVKHIVHAHGGEAWAKSELNKGATFYFTLPKKAAAVPIGQPDGND